MDGPIQVTDPVWIVCATAHLSLSTDQPNNYRMIMTTRMTVAATTGDSDNDGNHGSGY